MKSGSYENPEAGKSPRNAAHVGRGGMSETTRDYAQIKAELLSRNSLFEDPEFPASEESLFYKEPISQRLVWKRPTELVSNPKFILDDASRFDVRQGQLGDCWLLAAVASLSLHRELLERVVPVDQNFANDYCGLFRFRFWRYGKWQEIVVDDRLPTSRDRLVFMHSQDRDEFWSALLEKAYAKLVGSYEALKGGTTCEAMEDFTGGITELFDLKSDPPKNLFQIMHKAQQRCSLMGCSIEADPRRVEAHLPNGLIMGHAYSITGVIMVDISIPGKSGKIPMVRVRNPWGNEDEWKGAWSDKSPEWQFISEAQRRELGLTFTDDGEFWMSFQDFAQNFQTVEICHLGPQSLDQDYLKGTEKRRWEMCLENGEWKRRLNAGGCRNFINTFWTNPQYRVFVRDPDEDNDEAKGTIIVGLMQKGMRRRRREGIENHTIGYAIYRLEQNHPKPLDLKFFKTHASTAKSPAFINLREVCGRHELLPGNYVIVPSTFEPDHEAEFLLRIFSERPNQTEEIDEENEMENVQPQHELSDQEQKQLAALNKAFLSVAGADLEIDAYELQKVLNAAFCKEQNIDGFSLETSRSMVALMDTDQSGKLGFDEFKILWMDLRTWRTVFKKFDVDRNGNLNSYELRQAFNSVGFKISNRVFNSLVMRYADRQGVLRFDDFILCLVRLKTVFEIFKAQKKSPSGEALFDMETFVHSLMYT